MKMGNKIGELQTEIKSQFKQKYMEYQNDIINKW